MSRNGSSTDDDTPFSTQDLGDIFTIIRDKFGHLSKQEFVYSIVVDRTGEDLRVYRQALYDHCLKHVPGTHKATLVTRKNTSHKAGGTSLDVKLAEDIYKLLHYIQGDQTQDISRLFPDKIQLQIRNERITRSHSQTNMTSQESSTPLSSFQDTSDTNLAQSVIGFCRDFLTGMKSFQESIKEDVQDIKKDIALIREIKVEIVSIKQNISSLSERQRELDTYVKNHKKHLDNVRVVTSRLEQENVTSKKVLEERHTSLRNELAGLTQRINSLELNRANSYASVSSPLPQRPIPLDNTAMKRPDHPCDVVPDSITPSTSGSKPSTVQSLSGISSTTQPSEDKSVEDKSVEPAKPLAFQGFIPRDQRPKLDAIYVSGITTPGSEDEVSLLITSIIKEANLFVRSARIISHKGNTMAAKVVVREADVDSIINALREASNNTVRARRWITNDRDTDGGSKQHD